MRSQTRIPRILLFVILACICSWSMVFLAGFDRIPAIAEDLFGKPAQGMGRFTRFWLSAQLLYHEPYLTRPVSQTGSPVTFTVALGESIPAISERLFSEGLISNPAAFRLYLVYRGLDSSVQAGKFKLSPAMTPVEIAQALQDPTPTDTTIRILAGWRLEEVAATLPPAGIQISPEDFIKAATAVHLLSLPDGSRPAGSLEGFLIPDRYEVSRTITAQELLSVFTNRFKQNLTPDMLSGYSKQKVTVAQAVILASIVQREAALVEEMPVIASVFYNRLAAGMKLESDPTVQYALGYNLEKKTWWTNPLRLQDLKVNSTFNTYVWNGLPPGPICNPGIEALKAVAFPVQTGYYYFRAKCDGSGRHNFSITFDEHLQNGCP